MEYGNYMMFSNFTNIEYEPKPPNSQIIWRLEFDGSCASAGLGEGVMLISPKEELMQLAYKLHFRILITLRNMNLC